MNIKLISPHQQRQDCISSADQFKIQKVSLPLIAALTPTGHNIKIVDEAFAPDIPDEDVDLVGITVMTHLASRAYQIAKTYRQHGAKVVLGGIHPTVLPDEAIHHADTIVLGEAEEIWPTLVKDASLGKLKKIYQSTKLTDLSLLPIPRRNLYPSLKSRNYSPTCVGIETSRGCPFDCEFCSINLIAGKKYRSRPILEIVAEIESIQSPYLFFVDDSLALNPIKAKKLFTEMAPFKKQWIGEGTATIAHDLELLRLMKNSGCKGLLIGFESVDKNVQKSMDKTNILQISYSEVIRRFHDEGIPIYGSFVFGFDYETKEVFNRTLDFIMSLRMDGASLRILCPYPGTRFYKRLLRENRLIEPKWWLKGYADGMLLFRPKQMTPDTFIKSLNLMIKQFYSFKGIIHRFFGISPWKRSALGCIYYIGVNFANRKRYYKGVETSI